MLVVNWLYIENFIPSSFSGDPWGIAMFVHLSFRQEHDVAASSHSIVLQYFHASLNSSSACRLVLYVVLILYNVPHFRFLSYCIRISIYLGTVASCLSSFVIGSTRSICLANVLHSLLQNSLLSSTSRISS